MKVLATGLQFPEGPLALNDGSVLLTEVRSGHVTRVAPDGTSSLYVDCGGGPSALAVGPDGNLYTCNNGGSTYVQGAFASQGPGKDWTGGYIQKIDVRTRQVSKLYTHCGADRLSSPNDLVFDAQGGFYFSEFGKKHARHRDNGGLYYAAADGSGVREVAYNVPGANGVGLSPDGKVVYVAETETCRLWAFDLQAPGVARKHPYPSPHGGRFLCGLGGYQRFDSLAVTASGNICIGTLVSGCISVISPDGRLLRQVSLPDSYVTNLCFGGPDLRTAFVTIAETGRLVALDWDEPGLKLNFSL